MPDASSSLAQFRQQPLYLDVAHAVPRIKSWASIRSFRIDEFAPARKVQHFPGYSLVLADLLFRQPANVAPSLKPLGWECLSVDAVHGASVTNIPGSVRSPPAQRMQFPPLSAHHGILFVDGEANAVPR